LTRITDPMSIAGKVPVADERFSVVVVGAGPAGCAAAREAARSGADVLLVDEHPLDPGLIGLDIPYLFGSCADPSVQQPARMLERVVDSNPDLLAAIEAGVEVRVGTSVWAGFIKGPTTRALFQPLLGLADAGRSWLVGWKRLIVATGARDLALAFPGWDGPGVLGLQALHALTDRYAALSGRLLLFVGARGDAIEAARRCRARGLEIAALVDEGWCEPDPDLPILPSTVITGVERSAVGITAARLRDLRTGAEQQVACDTICLALGVVPQIELLDLLGCELVWEPGRGGYVPARDGALRTSRPEVYAIGDCAGVSPGARSDPGVGSAEGARAGWHAACSLGLALGGEPPLPAWQVGGEPLDALLRRWSQAIEAASPADLVLCQCEEVTRRDLRTVRLPRYLGAAPAAMAGRDLRTLLVDGPVSQDQVKRLTRAGMGVCQGRRCREQVACLLGEGRNADTPPIALPTWRPPLRPLPLSLLADQAEPPAMREGWHSWFGIPGMWDPPWAIAAGPERSHGE
jgi:thioredoxin reductase